jgi:hypothetical protein
VCLFLRVLILASGHRGAVYNLLHKTLETSRRCIMARITGLESNQVGWLTRLVYWFTRRSLRRITGQDRLPEPVKIAAHKPGLLRAVGRMEMAQGAARTVDRRLKVLASLRASTLAGCPF